MTTFNACTTKLAQLIIRFGFILREQQQKENRLVRSLVWSRRAELPEVRLFPRFGFPATRTDSTCFHPGPLRYAAPRCPAMITPNNYASTKTAWGPLRSPPPNPSSSLPPRPPITRENPGAGTSTGPGGPAARCELAAQYQSDGEPSVNSGASSPVRVAAPPTTPAWPSRPPSPLPSSPWCTRAVSTETPHGPSLI